MPNTLTNNNVIRRNCMGKPDVAIKNWLRNKVRFADLFNVILFEGEQIISADELTEANSESDIIIQSEKGKKIQQKYRDVVMRWNGVTLVMLALESQQKVNYAMPVRNMLYDSLSYSEQIRNIWNELDDEKKKKISTEELFSTFRKEDRLYPVVTVVFYFGGKTQWDGPMSLHDMFGEMSCDKRVKNIIGKCVPNYQINLFDVSNIPDIYRFKSDLHIIFGMLEYKKDKDKLYEYTQTYKEYFSYIDNDTRYATEVLLDADNMLKKFLKDNSDEGGTNMCEAIQGIHQDGIEKGKIEGKIEGKVLANISLICRKIQKGKTIETIADDLEDTVENIRPIYDAVMECGTDMDVEEIYEHMQSVLA